MNENNMSVVGGGSENSAMPLVSMILGIVSAVLSVGLWCCYGYVLGGPLAIAAVIIAIICKSKGIEHNKGFTITGLITGIVGILGLLAAIVYWVVYIMILGGVMVLPFL